jgi:hypothetical protein
MHEINDYVRWPSEIDVVQATIKKFLVLRERTNLHLSLRITPSIFTIYHLDTVFEFMIKHKIIAESCNILQDPSWMRIELLPDELKAQTLTKINNLVSQHKLVQDSDVILNRRRDDLVNPVISQVIFEYKQLLEQATVPENADEDLHRLVKFIKAFEVLRNNCILTYLPEYEKFLRSYGY